MKFCLRANVKSEAKLTFYDPQYLNKAHLLFVFDLHSFGSHREPY